MTAVAGILALACLAFMTLSVLAWDAYDRRGKRITQLYADLTAAEERVADYADRIVEHEARETALKIICRANGIEVVDPDAPLPLLDEAELVAVESPADIEWQFPEQRGGE